MDTNQIAPAPTLRELIADAIAKLHTYKHPNVSEVKARLCEILEAAGLGGIGNDHLDALEYEGHGAGEVLNVSTSWLARGSAHSDTKRLPVSILDAQNPVEAATMWRIERELREAAQAVVSAEETLARARDRLDKARAAAASTTGASS